MQKSIKIFGAKEHNLKNISIEIPHYSFNVITGVSGSGKSTLSYDIIHNEAQRRYLETFSPYARNYIGAFNKPNVEHIEGLSPVIAINQRAAFYNPRSTVGTITEIYDYLRLLFARISEAYSYVTGEKMQKYNKDHIAELIYNNYLNSTIQIYAPVVVGRKGHYEELFRNILKKGYIYARIDGEVYDLSEKQFHLDRYKTHFIEILIDEFYINEKNKNRLHHAVNEALKQGNNSCMIIDCKNSQIKYYSTNYICPSSGISYNDPAPFTFSFNSPRGACPLCKGTGITLNLNIKKVIPDYSKSISEGAIVPLGKYSQSLNSYAFEKILNIFEILNKSIKTPLNKLPQEIIDYILYGEDYLFFTNEPETVKITEKYEKLKSLSWHGVANYLMENYIYSGNEKEKEWVQEFIKEEKCKACNGYRLNKEALHFKILNKNIGELSEMELTSLYEWFGQLENRLTKKQLIIGKEIIKEIINKIEFILNIGLGYLTLNRNTCTLSGGEAQRIRLATQIGSDLINVTYILDEPSIGLHPADNEKLVAALIALKNKKNTIIVIEHDRRIIESADYIIDMGPHGGKNGGNIVAAGTINDIINSENSITGKYLKGEKKILIPQKRKINFDKKIILKGAKGNNLKNIDVAIPLNLFICVTGVSGSGKSSLICDTLFPALRNKLYKKNIPSLPYEDIKGYEFIDKVFIIDQKPIGKSPRSNIVTYTEIYTEIRNLFSQLPLAKINGYKPGRFSFNVKGGRCETCKGSGIKIIEMKFLPDVYTTCPDCNGKRFNKQTLDVKYKGRSIGDILEMTVSEAIVFFENVPSIHSKLKFIEEIGLGYLTLGQPASTFSGGEAQRLKLVYELLQKKHENNLYIFDEPTTGLHFEDINSLSKILHRLVDNGNTVIIIEHNIDIIKQADYIIELGPGSGTNGGYVVFEGTPEEMVEKSNCPTAKYLKEELFLQKI
ncbi:MAG: excinuclease ABC subunit UvrA [Bacteroidales bacterium]|nr:excinuclease ABC subunit UvrA [Bacteroidales bacterium]